LTNEALEKLSTKSSAFIDVTFLNPFIAQYVIGQCNINAKMWVQSPEREHQDMIDLS
jgi:hypothetical protein